MGLTHELTVRITANLGQVLWKGQMDESRKIQERGNPTPEELEWVEAQKQKAVGTVREILNACTDVFGEAGVKSSPTMRMLVQILMMMVPHLGEEGKEEAAKLKQRFKM